MLLLIILALLCMAAIFINPNIKQTILSSINGNIENVNEGSSNVSNTVVSSATIISTKTGTGPWDTDDEPGNDSSENNNIVRSFDQVTWTVDLTMNSKDNKAIAGSKIQVEATLPEETANVMKWDLSSMQWIDGGKVSSDGRILTGSYTVADTETSSSAKQTLVFVLQVYGVENATEIIPTFNFNIEGNDETEKVTMRGETITVSAAPNYNISLKNNSRLSKRISVDFDGNGEKETTGRVYGYGIVLQLYNTDKSKGLKGVEYPKGEITFDIETKLERTSFDNPSKVEDITAKCTPILYDYKINTTNTRGNLGRDMTHGVSVNGYLAYIAPYGVILSDRTTSVYNSGNITMSQNNNVISTTFSGYDFDGVFPVYNYPFDTTSMTYPNNIGCFSVAYFEILVPDNDYNTDENYNYNLTIEDKNFNATSISGVETTTQQVSTDDNLKVQHVVYKNGTYTQDTRYESVDVYPSRYNLGNGASTLGDEFTAWVSTIAATTNDEENTIYSVNKLVKFDADCYEPVKSANGNYYSTGTAEFIGEKFTYKMWFVTKKDGTNWKDANEMNNADIEDLVMYENYGDIPSGYVCVGEYFESQTGYIVTGYQIINLNLKVKETATIGQTYAIVHNTKAWKENLDRSVYTAALGEDVKWPSTIFEMKRNYVKTEYDENAQIKSGTHNSYNYGQSLLVLGGNLSVRKRSIEDDGSEKVNYDFSKNEYDITFRITPNISTSSTVKGIILKITDTLPKGMTYVAGSSDYGEPEITHNSDGTTTLVWYMYGISTEEGVDAITYQAHLDENLDNGTQLETMTIIEEVPDTDNESNRIYKIGNTVVANRTYTTDVNIINLASHRLYKETTTPVIEKNGDITYKVTYENKTEEAVPDFQLLDILPYNGDDRGSSFRGSYTLKTLNITQTIDGDTQSNGNLSVYTTNSDDVKTMDAKNIGIGTDSIWEKISTGEVNKVSKGVAIKGELAGKSKIELEITLSTNGNSAKDVYLNTAMAQVYSNSEQMQTSRAETRVVNRYIEGKVWQDSNSNGVIDEGEKYLSNVTVKLINSVNDSEVTSTKTNSNGQYSFTDLARGKYKIQIEVNETYYDLTEKEVGTNVEINSKFNQDTEETDEITRLDSIQSPELVESNLNAGLTIKKISIPVTKVWDDNDDENKRRPGAIDIVVKNGEQEVGKVELNNTNNWTNTFDELPKYNDELKEINYTLEEKEKNPDDMKFYTENGIEGNEEEGFRITNKFIVPDEKIQLEVTKNWVDQENVYGKRPASVRVNVRNNGQVVQTAVITKDSNWKHTFTNLAKYDENGREILYTVDEEEVMENDLYYYTGTSSLVENKEENKDVKEAIITNEMTKIPGKVVVKYVDKNTGLEILEEKVKEDAVGETFDVTEDVKDIEGYTLVEEPEEKTGTYTAEAQEKIYYYAKNTSVIVKYLEKDSTDDDADNEELSGEIILEGYEGKSYITNSKTIDGYTLVETKGKLSGTMTREEQVVVYYYAKNTRVLVKYVEKSTGNELLPEKIIDGYVGKEYTTVAETIPNYTLVEKTTNFEGTMTEDEIEVVYYYAQNTSVIVKYLEKDTNFVLVEEVLIEGYEGKDYETEKKDINNYTFVGDTGNTSGKMTKEPIEVIYYYAQNTKAKVEHIDRETGEILKEETTNGIVGDLFETYAEDFEGYVLVEEPEQPNIIMDKTGEQVVRYYYAHVSAGVIEKHIDIITEELLDSSEHEGNEGDPYKIDSKEFSGYDLVVDKLPDNAEGTMKRDEAIEVKYYYIKKATVIVKYVDENTGEEIEKEERIEGHENDEYSTEAKDVDGYNLTKIPDNGSGTMTVAKNPDGTYDTEIEVIYYYKKIAGGVIENHIDVYTDEKLTTERHEGNVGDEYDIPSRTFDGYDLVTDMLPDNSSGKMTEEEIIVNYYYSKRAKVTVEYIDKLTGEKITEDVIINGHIGDEYKAEEKTFDGYDLVEKPSNGEGEMKEEQTVVKYYYQRKAEVEVKYLEKGTEYEVVPTETISGYVADKYETEQKDVLYYNFVEKTENWKGEMTKEKITVIYYYEKQIFNLGVDKWVESVNVNGISNPAQNIDSSDEMYKIDVHASKADTADIKITYKIRITNNGEIEGTVRKITDIIPKGTTFNQEDNNIYWDNNNGILSTDDLVNEVIKPGEYKEIEVTLKVNKGSENFGEKDNMVILTETSNPAGYEDVDREDNSDTSSMILSVATGLDRNNIIVKIGIVQIVLGVTIVVLMSYKKKEKYNNK